MTRNLSRSANQPIYWPCGSESLSTEPAKTVQQLIAEGLISAEEVAHNALFDVDD